MTAKPHPMAGQSDSSDDLISELAKLMAQDAKGDAPAAKPSATFPVRIPGVQAEPTQAPMPRFGFERSPAPSVAPPAEAAKPVARPEAASPPAPRPAPEPEPFHFDFELGGPKTPAAVMPLRNEAPTSPIRVPADPTFVPVDHDSIADLIAAELLSDPEPQPAPAIRTAAEAPAPRAAQTQPAPSGGWAPAAVNAERSTPDQPTRHVLRPLNLQPAIKPEQDRFKVAPVFGLASGSPAKPAAEPVAAPAPAPQPEPMAIRSEPSFAPAPAPVPAEPFTDPLDDIENLIGRAMRVELDRSIGEPVVSERLVPSPALRSLATPAAPPAPAPGRPVSGADEAILAAAEATGVQVGWVDAPVTPQTEEAPARARSTRALGMTRALAGPLVAVTLLLAAGFGLYWVLGLGRDSGPPPLLTADATPVKETPAVEAATDPAQSVVFNEIDGVVPGAEEQLVSRDQALVNEVTQVPPTTELSQEGLANRKVRTVTVRPDGTIVSGDDTVAGSNILPVARPEVPVVPGTETASAELLANAEPVTATPPAAVAEPAPVAQAVPVTPGETVPAVDLAGNPIQGRSAVIPRIRPDGLTGPSAAETVLPVNSVVNGGGTGNLLPPPPANNTLGLTTAAPATQAVVAQPVEVPALGNTAPAYAQLASLRTEDEARAAAQGMVTRYGPVFGGANLEVQRVDLGQRGIYYRVRVPAGSLQDANNICVNVKAAGGDCVPM